jgi:DNA-binding MarR family transcriptional regulator
MAMAHERLSRLQRRILTWLWAEDQRTRGTMAASHQDLVHAVGGDKGNVSTSLKGLERKGLIRIHRTSGGHAEAVDLTAEGRKRVAALTASCEEGEMLMNIQRLSIALAVLLALASPALAGNPTRCQTYPEPTMGRWQTLCDDGTRAVSTYNKTLERWDTTVTPPPGQTCEGRLNPTSRQWEGRCR